MESRLVEGAAPYVFDVLVSDASAYEQGSIGSTKIDVGAAPGAGVQAELLVPETRRAEPVDDLGAHLEPRCRDARPDRRQEPSRLCVDGRSGADRGCDDVPGSPPPAGVHRGNRSCDRVPQQDGHTVSDSNRDGKPGAVGPEPIALGGTAG
jgi:hypothetical protein